MEEGHGGGRRGANSGIPPPAAEEAGGEEEGEERGTGLGDAGETEALNVALQIERQCKMPAGGSKGILTKYEISAPQYPLIPKLNR